MPREFDYQSETNPEFSGTKQLQITEVGLLKYSTEIVTKIHLKLNLSKTLDKQKIRILDFGAGTGFLADIFSSKFGILPECVELDPTLMQSLISKGFMSFRSLKDTKGKYDYIYSSNVLEHIPNDIKAFSELYDSLIPGGMIAIYVPAHPILFSEMDKRIGHVRRYKKKELSSKVLSVGFEIQEINYDDFIGFFISYVIKKVGYKEDGKLASHTSLMIYDRLIYPISKFLDNFGFRHILGKNLLLIARKPKS